MKHKTIFWKLFLFYFTSACIYTPRDERKFYIRIGMKRQSSSNWQNWTAKQDFFFMIYSYNNIEKKHCTKRWKKKSYFHVFFPNENNMKILHLFDICGFCIYFFGNTEEDEHSQRHRHQRIYVQLMCTIWIVNAEINVIFLFR